MIKRQIVISPEFKNYLRALKAEGKKHLYINLMKRVDNSRPDEKQLSELLSHFPINSDLCLTQPNAQFILQQLADFVSQKDLKKFNLKWPSKFDLKEWQKVSKQLLVQLHQITFNGKEHLTMEEVKDFISLIPKTIINDLHSQLKKATFADDEMLSRAIEELENDPELSGAIEVVTLDENSAFFRQGKDKDLYTEQPNASLFKKDFLINLTQTDSEKSFYKWPKGLDLEQWKMTCKGVIEDIHTQYFSNNEHLTLEERKAFLSIVTAKIIKELHQQLKPNYSNISCKHTMDRGPSTFSLVYLLDRLEEKGNLTQEEIQSLATMLFVPSILNHNRRPASERFEQFYLAFQALMKPIMPKIL